MLQNKMEKDYPVWQAVMDGTAILLLITGLGYLVWSHMQAAVKIPLAWLIAVVLTALLAADFISGMVHFLADSFGSIDTPFFGKTFIYPFREHHADPLAITRHSYLETNGANSIISLPVLGIIILTTDAEENPFLRIWIFVFLGAIFLTNQIHKWAHMPRPPLLPRMLQHARLILTPEGHAVHHTPPHSDYFCITNGWLNGTLSYIHFFRFLKSTLSR